MKKQFKDTGSLTSERSNAPTPASLPRMGNQCPSFSPSIEIKLGKNGSAFADAADAAILSGFKWYGRIPEGRKAKTIIFSEMMAWLKSRQITAKGAQ